MNTYKIVISVTGGLGAGYEADKKFMESLKAKFVDHLPMSAGDVEVRLVSIEEEDE